MPRLQEPAVLGVGCQNLIRRQGTTPSLGIIPAVAAAGAVTAAGDAAATDYNSMASARSITEPGGVEHILQGPARQLEGGEAPTYHTAAAQSQTVQ